MDEKTKYRKEYYLKNKNKLIEYGKKYYLTRINPTVETTIVHGEFILFFDYPKFGGVIIYIYNIYLLFIIIFRRIR